MIKFRLLISIFILLFSAEGFGQIRHVRGIRAVDAYYLHSKFGSGAGASYVKYFSNSLYGKGSVFFEKGSDSGLSYRSIGGEISLAKTIVHAGHKYYLNGMGGCIASMDAITEGGEQFNLSSEFKTGAFGGIENELFISDKLVFVLSWTQRILIRDAFGNYRWFAEAGFRFNL